MMYIGGLKFDDEIKKAEGIIVFGGGSMLPYLLKKMKQLNIAERIVAICDNNIAIQGKEVSGVPIMSPKFVCENYREFDFIVYNQYYMEICEQLHRNHIEKIHLIRSGSI